MMYSWIFFLVFLMKPLAKKLKLTLAVFFCYPFCIHFSRMLSVSYFHQALFSSPVSSNSLICIELDESVKYFSLIEGRTNNFFYHTFLYFFMFPFFRIYWKLKFFCTFYPILRWMSIQGILKFSLNLKNYHYFSDCMPF